MSFEPSLEDVLDTYFPYDEPRDAQEVGIRQGLQTATQEGVMLFEGACGSGKTMLSLIPYIAAVRSDKTKYERIVVATSVKQQLKEFEKAIEDINQYGLSDSDSSISAMTMTGKADVCPYVIDGDVQRGDIYDECESVRDGVRDVVANSKNELDVARSLYQNAPQREQEDRPFAAKFPDFNETEYCPYYAQHVAAVTAEDEGGNEQDPVPFSQQESGMIGAEELVSKSARNGTCPHSVMTELIEGVEVLIANYYHIFDDVTVSQMMSPVVDDSTLLIIDEAHNLTERVSSLLGEGMAFDSLQNGVGELDEVLRWLTPTLEDAEIPQAIQQEARQAARELTISAETIEEFRDFVDDVIESLASGIQSRVDSEYSLGEEEVFPLQPVENIERDMLSRSLSTVQFEQAANITEAVHAIRERVYQNQLGHERLPNTTIRTVGRVLHAWSSRSPVTSFRQVTLTQRPQSSESAEFAWESDFTARVEVKNCIPKHEIAERLDSFGALTLMSATLAPMDSFRKVTGIDQLAAEGRPVIEEQHGLPFPAEHRESLAVDMPAFNYSNRGERYTTNSHGKQRPNLNTTARKNAGDILMALTEKTDGNVLAIFPSYAEAEWAGDVLLHESEISATDIYVDASTSDAATESLKQEFFADDGQSVLLTSAFGTLIEGVDYAGDRLKIAAVFGVPMKNTQSPFERATRARYKHQTMFGQQGDEHYLVAPAVRKARQAIGRVIRTDEDTGIRVLADERYTIPDSKSGKDPDWNCSFEAINADDGNWRTVRKNRGYADDEWNNVRYLLTEDENREFKDVIVEGVRPVTEGFWSFVDG